MMTPHFHIWEVGDNVPKEGQLRALMLAAAVLEPWRERVGALSVTSWYRTKEHNAAIGGSPTSQHMVGEGVDVIPRTDKWNAFRTLYAMAEAGLPVDQAIIYEGTNHIHVSHTAKRTPRRQFLYKTGGKYVEWRP